MPDMLGEAALTLYRATGRILRPGLGLVLEWRARHGKEDRSRRHERLGSPRRRRPCGPLVWVHAASVGETVAVLPLVERLILEGFVVLTTTGTVTSARIAADRLPVGAIHQFVPLDVDVNIDRFLDHWRPGAALFVESEIWPATVDRLRRRGIPLVLVNARMSERSHRRWARLDGIARALFGRLDGALAQNDGDAERLKDLGVGQTVVTGNLKFDGAALGHDPRELARLQGVIGQRPTWAAASTHPGEELMAAEAHRIVRQRLPRILTVIAPRHPERGDALRADLADLGLAVASRSRGELPGPGTDIYLADTIGEMGLVYRLAPMAFVGGSVTPRGGQNPIEPARLDCVVLHGPSTHNFAEIYADLDACGGAVTIEGAADLAAAILDLHATHEHRETIAGAARSVVDRSSGALGRTLDALAPVLEAARAREPAA